MDEANGSVDGWKLEVRTFDHPWRELDDLFCRKRLAHDEATDYRIADGERSGGLLHRDPASLFRWRTRHLRDLLQRGSECHYESWRHTCEAALGKTRVEEAVIRWPQALVRPRTAFTDAVRSRTMNARARISVSASCCSTVRYEMGRKISGSKRANRAIFSASGDRSCGRCERSPAAHARSPR